MSPETLKSDQEQMVASISAEFQPFMRNVFRYATNDNVDKGLTTRMEAHIARVIAQAVLGTFELDSSELKTKIAEAALRYLGEDAYEIGQTKMITLLQQRYALPLTLEDLSRAVDFNYFVKRVINECRNCQEIDLSDIFLIREEAEELKDKYEKETGFKPRWYQNAPEIFEMAARLEKYGLILPLDRQFTFNAKAWFYSLLNKHSPEKADLLLEAAKQKGISLTEDEMSAEIEMKIYRIQPEDIDKLTYLHPDIAAFIKNVLIFKEREREWDNQNPIPPNLNRFDVQDAIGNIANFLIEVTDIQEQFRILEEITQKKYGYDGGDPLLQFLIEKFKLPLNEEAIERIRKYYKDHSDQIS